MAKLSGKSNQQSTGVVAHHRYGYLEMYACTAIISHSTTACGSLFYNDAVFTSNGLEGYVCVCGGALEHSEYPLRIASHNMHTIQR